MNSFCAVKVRGNPVHDGTAKAIGDVKCSVVIGVEQLQPIEQEALQHEVAVQFRSLISTAHWITLSML